jgi:hypothetical protein
MNRSVSQLLSLSVVLYYAKADTDTDANTDTDPSQMSRIFMRYRVCHKAREGLLLK